MKYLIILYLIFILCNACCTKKDCLNVFDINEISLIDFEMQELDSIFVIAYTKNNDFTKAIDSAYVTSIGTLNATNNFVITIPISFFPEYDYRLEFRKIDFIAEITDIKVASEKCNTCFLTKDKYSILESYQINGVLRTNKAIEIAK